MRHQYDSPVMGQYRPEELEVDDDDYGYEEGRYDTLIDPILKRALKWYTTHEPTGAETGISDLEIEREARPTRGKIGGGIGTAAGMGVGGLVGSIVPGVGTAIGVAGGAALGNLAGQVIGHNWKPVQDWWKTSYGDVDEIFKGNPIKRAGKSVAKNINKVLGTHW